MILGYSKLMPIILIRVKKVVVIIIILALAFPPSFPIFAQTIVPPERPSPTKPRTIPGSIIVQFKDNPQFEYESKQEITIPFLGQKIETRKEGFASKKFSSITTITKEAQVQGIRAVYGNLPQSTQKDKVFVLQTPEGLTSPTITKLKNDPNVVLAQPNYVYSASFTPNDPYFSQTPLSHYQWNMARINAPLAWDITKGGTNVKVAVIDTGVAIEDYTEGGIQYRKAPELANAQIAAKYRHVSISCTGTYTCNCTNLATPIVDTHPLDKEGHGTHVSQTILQAMNNNTHATGIAPNVSLVAIRASSEGSNGGCFADTDLLAALEFAKQNGAHVVNMSLGGPGFDTAQNQKIQELISLGITVVAAAGNAGNRTSSPPIDFPAGYTNVIAVGAARWDNVRTKYSSYSPPSGGHNVTLVAPGGQVINDQGSDFLDQNNDSLPDGIVQQTIIEGQPNNFTQVQNAVGTDCGTKKCVAPSGIYCSINNACGLYIGTSMAAPHVTAAVALIKSVNINLPPTQVQQILIQTANKTAIPGYNENEYGAGLLDLYAAVIAAGGSPTQKGWNKLLNLTVSTSSCPTWSQKVLRWLPSRVNYLQNTILSTSPNFYKCN